MTDLILKIRTYIFLVAFLLFSSLLEAQFFVDPGTQISLNKGVLISTESDLDIQGTMSCDSTSGFRLNGKLKQEINSNGEIGLGRIFISNPNGVELFSKLNVHSEMSFTSGHLFLNAGNLGVSRFTSLIGYSSNSFIVSNSGNTVELIGLGSGQKTLPLGSAIGVNNYTPITLSGLSPIDTITVRVVDGVWSSYSVNGSPLGNRIDSFRVEKSWVLNSSAATSSLGVELQFDPIEEGPGFNRSNCGIDVFNSSWQKSSSSNPILGNSPYFKSDTINVLKGSNVLAISSINFGVSSSRNNGCIGDSILLAAIAPPGASFQWNMNGLPIPGAKTKQYYAGQSGVYNVLIKLGIDSVLTTGETITFYASPSASLNLYPATICFGDTAFLQAPNHTTWTYNWFKNGAALNSFSSPTITSLTSGTFELVVENLFGCLSDTLLKKLNVNPLPISTISGATHSICYADTTLLMAPLSATNIYQWYKNDTSISGAFGAIYTAKESGNFTVSVTDTNSCTAFSTPFNLIKASSPVSIPIVRGATNKLCFGDSVALITSKDGFEIEWRLNGVDLNYNDTILWARANGSYQSVLSRNGTCEEASAPFILSVLNPLISSSIWAQPMSSFCKGDSLLLRSNSNVGFNYIWKKDTTTLPYSTDSIFVHETGSYTVSQELLPGCGAVSSALPVFSMELESSGLAASISSFCKGDSAVLRAINTGASRYQWLIDEAVIPGAEDTFYIAKNPGKYSLVVFNAISCSDTSQTINVVVHELPKSTLRASNTIICNNDSVLLIAPPVNSYSYQWFANNISLSGETDSLLYTNAPGSYYCRISNSLGCEVESKQIVLKKSTLSKSSIIAPNGLEFCFGDSSLLMGISGVGISYKWFKDSVLLNGINTRNYLTKVAGSYQVLISDTTGCESISSFAKVIVNPLPLQPTIFRNLDTLFTSSGSNIQWFKNDSVLINQNRIFLILKANGNYHVRATDSNSCFINSAILQINNVSLVENVHQRIAIIPNPNKGVFKIETEGVLLAIKLYNLQGKLIYQDFKGDKIIDLNSTLVESGIYILEMANSSGTVRKKVVIDSALNN